MKRYRHFRSQQMYILSIIIIVILKQQNYFSYFVFVSYIHMCTKILFYQPLNDNFNFLRFFLYLRATYTAQRHRMSHENPKQSLSVVLCWTMTVFSVKCVHILTVLAKLKQIEP